MNTEHRADETASQAVQLVESLTQSVDWSQLWSAPGNAGTASLLLLVFWSLLRSIRKAIALLFMICVIYLTLRFAFGIDLAELI
ncbi:MAG TPA: hypothetical protein H9862_05825 [Candidatus Akkermansia intestinigallinarum]|uniref:Uncharacterized protein n=1 Tax=Candidatus Akkermansia intestinigallinarum TaxID=2838431 RepID=A0A9D2AI54_9BACT|nr:hypothetical protein [Candidatus Akkermansia intestinigallinarum]